MENENIITVQEMANILKISRSKAYEIIREETCPIIKIGKCIRINKKEFFEWLNISRKRDIIINELESREEEN